MEYSIITVSKGTINTVDSFIKYFRSIGHNMKALAVSAYNLYNSDDVEVKKEFKIKVKDELNMSDTTLSQLKNAGYLYQLHDGFSHFSYTNVVEFMKMIKLFNKDEIEINDANIEKMFRDLALFSNSHLITEEEIDEINEIAINYLAECSQKVLRGIIEKFIKSLETDDTPVETEEDTEEDTEDTEDVIDEEVEQAHFYNIIDEDFDGIMYALKRADNDKKMTKQELLDTIHFVLETLNSYNKY